MCTTLRGALRAVISAAAAAATEATCTAHTIPSSVLVAGCQSHLILFVLDPFVLITTPLYALWVWAG